MNTLNQYSQKLSVISEIRDDQIEQPGNIPVGYYIQEAENLNNWCQPDRERLCANGLDWTIVDDLPARIDTLREAQARWVASDSNDLEAEKLWDEKSPQAHEFRLALERALKFAFRGNRTALLKIRKMHKSGSSAAMIQSLRNLSVFGREHSEFLSSSTFDMTMLDKAEEMSREMADLLGTVSSRRAFCSSTLKIRNQAYTHLKNAISEIKSHANYIFWREPDRLRGYASDYNRRRNRSRKKSSEVEAVSVQA